MMPPLRRRAGMTLIESLVIIGILGLLFCHYFGSGRSGQGGSETDLV